MLFTQLDFWYLFATVLVVLMINQVWLRSITVQNVTLLIASYVFYGAWDVRFLILIAMASAQTWYFGTRVIRDPHGPAAGYMTAISVVLNLTILGVFKYFDFFLGSLEGVGLLTPGSFDTLSIILPVGISFYIFQTLTFVVDAKRGQITKVPSVLDYFTYVAFFPQLVAGPIERARKLLPQFETVQQITWDNIYSGTRMIIFGLFLKVVIADQLAPVTDAIFGNYETLDGGTLMLGLSYFSAQIYGDFCGYSTIAIGVARCMGFTLSVNFWCPYWVRSLGSHWRHWHISLGSFFRDYVYIPLGGSRGTAARVALVTVVTFALSGLWHGAAWGFIIWGVLHGTIVAFERLAGLATAPLRARLPGFLGAPGLVFGWGWALFWIFMSWPFFRLGAVDGWDYIQRLVSDFGIPQQFRSYVLIFPLVAIVDALWWRDPKLDMGTPLPRVLEETVLALMLALSVSYLIFALDTQPFIYFQF